MIKRPKSQMPTLDEKIDTFLARKSFSYRSLKHEGFCDSRQITVSGLSGSGTSTLGRKLVENLPIFPYELLSAGQIQRAKALELEMSLPEFIDLCLSDPAYDLLCDKAIIQNVHTNPNLVIEARVGHFLAPHAFHILLVCSSKERFKRCHERELKKDPHADLQTISKSTELRDAKDIQRLGKRYPHCWWDDHDYDLVIDTGKFNEDEVLGIALEAFQNRHQLPAWSTRMDLGLRVDEAVAA